MLKMCKVFVSVQGKRKNNSILRNYLLVFSPNCYLPLEILTNVFRPPISKSI